MRVHLVAGVCLTGAGGARGFVSPWAAWPVEVSHGAVTCQRRGGMNMVSNTEKKEPAVIRVSDYDKAMARKTPKERLDDESFPILELNEEEDANIKVTPNAWKWPPLWPYTPDYFDRADEQDDELAYQEPRMNAFLTAEAKEATVEHYKRFLMPGTDILELGASVDSYLPEGVEFNRVVGVGMNLEEMEANPALSGGRIVQNINKNGALPFESDSFDFVLLPNFLQYLSDPRFLMREVYRVLKPKGLCMVPFTSKGAYKDLEKKEIKMWKTMNDAQHMWIIGSFFKFSANAGWDDLKGYDMSPKDTNIISGLVKGKNNVFVVQASKAIPPDATDIRNVIRNRLYGTKSLDTDDVDFSSLRLFAQHSAAKTEEEKEAVMNLIDPLVDIYTLLGEMKPGVLFSPYKAIVAVGLAPIWDGSEKQKAVLREGLGLLPPTEDVWKPLGEKTSFLHPEDRVVLLVDIVKAFLGPEDRSEALSEIKDVLPQMYEVLKVKVPGWTLPDAELMATDIILTDFLPADRESRAGFMEWFEGVDKLELEMWLDQRKNFKLRAKEDLQMGGRRFASI